LASKADRERVFDQHTGVGLRECAGNTSESDTIQHQIDYEVRTTSATNSFEDAGQSQRQEYQGHMPTGGNAVADATKSSTTRSMSAVMTQNQMPVSKMEDTIHHCTPQQSMTSTFPESQATTTIRFTTMNGEEVWKSVSPVLAPENVLATESRRSSVAEEDKQTESEDLKCTPRIDGSCEPPINPLSS
jgi:hypothetical protein